MKRILVFSDSHGYKEAVDRLFERINDYDYVYFLGDGYGDVYDYQNMYPDKVEVVMGNQDRYFDIPEYIINKVEDLNIMLTHGHLYHIKYGYESMIYAAKFKQVDLILFGHTHLQTDTYIDDMHIINPGALGTAYYKGTYCELYINGKELTTVVRQVSELFLD